MNNAFKVVSSEDFSLFIPQNQSILSSNCIYFHKSNILVDPGNPILTRDLINSMHKIGIDHISIKSIYCTHLHIDHIGAFWLFPDAKTYASKEELSAFFDSNKYFLVDENVYSSKVINSLHLALKMLSEHNYEKSLLPFDSSFKRFNDLNHLTTDSQGYFVFPSHTLGSTILILDKTALWGDLFSLDSSLDWVPNRYQDKINLLHSVKRVFGKSRMISGHMNQLVNATVSNVNNSTKALKFFRPKRKLKNGVRIHPVCDENGRIISEYFTDKSGNRTIYKQCFFERKFSYNQSNLVFREFYFDSSDKPVADDRGRYGAQYNYNDIGQCVLLTGLDSEYNLIKNDHLDYLTSSYYYSPKNINKITARVDFNNKRITDIKYFTVGFVVDPEEALKHYYYLVEKLSNNELL